MIRAIQQRWTGSPRLTAGMVVRCCVAVWLVLKIVYTPLHLYLEPHTDTADVRSPVASDRTAGIGGLGSHDERGDTDQHSVAQHKLQGLRSSRTAAMDQAFNAAVEWAVVEIDTPTPQVLTESEFSPPELSSSWQFFLRTALPVRAPSLLS